MKDFVTNLNSQHPSIKFSYQIFDKSIDFLDTTVYIKNRRLHTTIFIKPTDRQNCLHYKAEHPLSFKNNIPFGQILRIKRICSEALEFLRNCTKIISRFTQRGYPESITQEAYYKTTFMQRKSLLQTEKRKDHKEYNSLLHTTEHYLHSVQSSISTGTFSNPTQKWKKNLVKDQF